MTIKGVRIGLKNLWRWKGVVWKDRDWDWWFLLRVLQYKLGAMEEYFKQSAITDDATEVAREIRDAKGAVDFILNDGPAEIAWSGWKPYEDMGQDEWEKSLSKPLPDEWYERQAKEEELTKEALARVFDGMRDNVRGWWD